MSWCCSSSCYIEKSFFRERLSIPSSTSNRQIGHYLKDCRHISRFSSADIFWGDCYREIVKCWAWCCGWGVCHIQHVCFPTLFTKLLLESSNLTRTLQTLGSVIWVLLISDIRMSTCSQFSLITRLFMSGYKLTLRFWDYLMHNVMIWFYAWLCIDPYPCGRMRFSREYVTFFLQAPHRFY